MSRPREYRMSLSKKERNIIKSIQKKTHCSLTRTRCSILLAADENRWKQVKSLEEIGTMAGATSPTIISTIGLFLSGGIDNALKIRRNPKSDTSRLKVTGDVEARIIAKACSAPPEGYTRWTLSLLTYAMKVILEEPVSRATVGRVLNRNDLRPHLNSYWCIPPEADADFVASMEEILDLYQMPYDPTRPLWCMDEKPYQILGDIREPIPMKPGDVMKVDSEYERNGTAAIFCFIQPHTGKIKHFVEPTRTAVDWAEKIRYLVDKVEPEAEKVILVMDNLNTHKVGSLYKAFLPEEADRIRRKIEIHHTPVHGSWLDIAEIGINIMTRQCLNRRIGNLENLRQELAAWNEKYNENPTPIDWQFTKSDSRIKLKRLYPDIEKTRKERDERVISKSE